jgi:hypothetical protein
MNIEKKNNFANCFKIKEIFLRRLLYETINKKNRGFYS